MGFLPAPRPSSLFPSTCYSLTAGLETYSRKTFFLFLHMYVKWDNTYHCTDSRLQGYTPVMTVWAPSRAPFSLSLSTMHPRGISR